MNEGKRIAQMYIRQVMAYEAKGDFERMVGHILSDEMGITDAPENFFQAAHSAFQTRLKDEGLEENLKDNKVYPLLHQAIQEAAKKTGLFQ